jgi:DNA polymerase III subunit epsilon
MTSFLAIDFETADTQPDSACSVGLVRVENGLIVQEVMKLIRPPREKVMFTYIHGLTWEHVCDAPSFGEIWPEVAPLFQGVDYLIAHNASFDRRVLEACCASHGIEAPTLSFKCTVQIARKALGIYPTKLSDVCRTLEIDLNHHEALSDARACAKIMIQAMAYESSEQGLSAVES